MTIEDEDEQGTVRGEDAEPEETEEEESPESSDPAPSAHLGAQTANVVKGVREGTAALGAQIAASMRSDDPDDETSADVQRSFNAAAAVVGAVEQGAKAWDQAEDSARATDDTVAASKGIDAAGSTGALTAAGLDAIGLATEDQGVRDAATAVRGATIAGVAVAKQIATFVQAANASEDAEDDAEGASDEAEESADEAAEESDEAASGTARRRATAADPEAAGGEASFSASELEGGEESHHVRYELHLPESEATWAVRSATLSEALSEPYALELEVATEDVDADSRELLGTDVELLLDRGPHNRRVTGVVRRVVESDARTGDRLHATLYVVPALWALSQDLDSHIYQGQSAKEVLEELLGEALQPYGREVDVAGLEATYPPREHCARYQESSLAFCQRLMEEEGIGYFFDFSEGWEKLVLFDANGQLPEADRLDADHPVPFETHAEVVAGAEPVTRFSAAASLRPTAQRVRDYDWTLGRSQTAIESEVEGEDAQGRTRARFDHGHGRTVTRSDYGGERYGAHDAERQASIRHELSRRDATDFSGVSAVTGLSAGCTFELTGHPTPGVDGAYLVTRVTHHSAPLPGARGDAERYHNTFDCIPLATPWRPERRTPKPAIYGVQTALVTGGGDGEIHTDRHGRIRVLFHWDRDGASAATSSAWVRVAQVWAGHDGAGYPGFVFIPRVGMEVVVTFLHGDPDRPLVTGAVYNGTNLPPESLPGDASRSMIRTRSLGGDGYNELSFEDAAGGEEVHLRAERNLRELVQNDHTTRVGHDQTLQVDNEQRVTVDDNQTVHVKGALRDVHADHEEHYAVDENRRLTVGGFHEVAVHGEQRVEVDQVDTHVSHTGRFLTVEHGLRERIDGSHQHRVESGGFRSLVQESYYQGISGGEERVVTGGRTVEVSGEQSFTSTGPTNIDASAINLTATTAVNVTAPQGIKNTTPGTHRSTATAVLDYVVDHSSVGSSKMSAYGMALSLYASKIDIVDLKVDVYAAKITNNDLTLRQVGAAIQNTMTAQIVRAPINLIS